MRTVTLSLLASMALVSCGSSTALQPDAASCPDLSGSWTVTAHCVPSQVGQTFSITQTGCTYGESYPGWTGSVAADGTLTSSGPAGDKPMTCTGTSSGSPITMSCNPTCDVAMTRASR